MNIFQRIGGYFSKNGGLNTITGTIIPVGIQVIASTDPTLASIITTAFTPEVSTQLLGGGVGGVVALVIVGLRVFIGWRKLKQERGTPIYNESANYAQDPRRS